MAGAVAGLDSVESAALGLSELVRISELLPSMALVATSALECSAGRTPGERRGLSQVDSGGGMNSRVVHHLHQNCI